MRIEELDTGLEMDYNGLVDFINMCYLENDYDKNLVIQADGGDIVWESFDDDTLTNNIHLIWKHSREPIGLNRCVLTQGFKIVKLSPRDITGRRLDKVVEQLHEDLEKLNKDKEALEEHIERISKVIADDEVRVAKEGLL